ncbi:fumarylacetoacetate hydrolase family protein [Acidaminobacter sp.]|uniref:fumarylacetoacetate hydrolase family protein n=1 Tax=Acidaminobacter sp. TaxID=1872102 RepID=UPI00255F5E12|nr:fumarylacetoacetate hydrolase family protein [Acidaminobacter sp.]MDK9711927.1 fumarylacetoacetate hydrolase family protein [Acidaminobacter sp.]
MNTVLFDGLPVTPSKVVCIGRNFVAHIEELQNEMPDAMVLFMKPNAAISGMLKAWPDKEIHYEGELSFIISEGKIRGVGFGLDLTDRKLQSTLKAKGLPWERAKAFDGAAVFGDFEPIEEEDIPQLAFQLWINDELRQEGDVNLMIHKPLDMLEEVKTMTTLEDGDILMTGTPKGVGTFQAGDRVVGKIFMGLTELMATEWIVNG